jgi:hypothetical protein
MGRPHELPGWKMGKTAKKSHNLFILDYFYKQRRNTFYLVKSTFGHHW